MEDDRQINFDKMSPETSFDDVKIDEFLIDKCRPEYHEFSNKQYFWVNRESAWWILTSCSWKPLTDKKKHQIKNLIEKIKSNREWVLSRGLSLEDYKIFPSTPPKPITINVDENHIEDGVKRLFAIFWQRQAQPVWIHLKYKEEDIKS